MLISDQESNLQNYEAILQREWFLERLYQDLKEQNLTLTQGQENVLKLILCGLAPKEIGEILGKKSNAIRNQLANAIVPKIMSLCNTNPEQSIVFSDIPMLLAKCGYANSSWLWLQSKAKMAYDLIRPLTSAQSGSFRDITDGLTPGPEDTSCIPEVKNQTIVNFEFQFPPTHNVLVLNKGVSQKVYCLVPSRYAPKYVGVNKFPLSNHDTIKFSSVGQEQFLAIVSPEPLLLSWLNESTFENLPKLEPIHLDELASVIQETENVDLYYSSIFIT